MGIMDAALSSRKKIVPRPRFSLRGLLLLMVPVALLSCWVGIRYRAQMQEENALEAITAASSFVKREPDTLGFFSRTVEVHFGPWNPYPVPDPALHGLSKLPRLEVLSFASRQLDDPQLKFIGRCRQLQSVNLSGTAVTNDGLRHLTGLTKLRELDVANTGVTDEGVAMLQDALPELQIYDD